MTEDELLEPDGEVSLLEMQIHQIAREEARKEISSLCGLVLRRTQDMQMFDAAVVFGEALADFSGHTKGEEPGE